MPQSAIAQRRGIAAPPADVWGLISTAGHLTQCHPFCAANPVKRWPGAGSRDEVHYYNGRRITRDFAAWHDGAGFDIDITDANGAVAGVTWRLEPEGGGSALTIAVTPRFRFGAVAGPSLRRYLRSVLAGVEHRVTTGDPVRRNQFGSHRWFSP